MHRILTLALATGFAMAADVTVGTATLTIPPDWTSHLNEGTLTLISPLHTPHIQVRIAAGEVATTKDTVSVLIADQVKNFVPDKTEEVTLGANHGVRLTGTGVEADDGDPANAEVTILRAGTTTVLVISHGEGKGTEERRDRKSVV